MTTNRELPEASKLPEGEDPTVEALESLLSIWLRVGTILVILALGGAFLWALATRSFPSMAPVWSAAWTHFSPTTLVMVGAALLALLPPARVILAGVSFARSKEWRYVIFSAVALGFVALSNVLGTLLRKG